MERSASPNTFLTALSIGLTTFVVFGLITSDLLVFTEARSYIVHRGWAESIRPVRFFLLPEGTNTRYTSMLFFALHARLFGASMPCANLVQAFLLGLAGSLAFLHATQVTRQWSIALFSTLAWLFSAPALGAALWQATQHDKLAMVFSLMALLLCHHGLNLGARDRVRTVVYSGILLLLLTMAYNSKEISFFLPVAMVGLLGHVRSQGKHIGRTQAGLLLGMPLAYSAWFCGIYFSKLTGQWASHVVGGDLRSGIVALLSQSLNLGNFMNLGQWGELNRTVRQLAVYGYAGFVLVLAVVLVAAVRAGRLGVPVMSPKALADGVRSWSAEIYFAFIALLLYLACARSAYPSAFYLLIGIWAAAVFFFLFIRRLAKRTSRPRLAWSAMFIAAAVPFLMSYSTHYLPGGVVPRMRSASNALIESFIAAKALAGGQKLDAVNIVLPGNTDIEWYVFTGIPHEVVDQDLGPFLFGSLERRPRISLTKSATEAGPSENGTLQVSLGNDYSLRELRVGGREIVTSDLR